MKCSARKLCYGKHSVHIHNHKYVHTGAYEPLVGQWRSVQLTYSRRKYTFQYWRYWKAGQGCTICGTIAPAIRTCFGDHHTTHGLHMRCLGLAACPVWLLLNWETPQVVWKHKVHLILFSHPPGHGYLHESLPLHLRHSTDTCEDETLWPMKSHLYASLPSFRRLISSWYTL